jgi:Heparinase II/III-like protein/Heparinase II/III N-terminus
MPNWKKIKELRFDELRVRSAQKLAALAERQGWSSLTKLPSDTQLLAMLDLEGIDKDIRSAQEVREHLRSSSGPKFFASFHAQNSTVEQLQTRWPQAEQEILERANRIMQGQFDLLGFRSLSFGQPIDWHLEPVSEKRTPLIHWSRLDYLDAEIAGDKKIVWELNRHQYFVTLGQAYWLTGDERYAQTFATHLESWMEGNPPKLGMNWASSLEVAFRSISWLWAFNFFKQSPSFTSRTFMRALRFLYLHARHLETYLSTYFSPNTHLTGEALGLYYLGLLLPEFRDAARWRETGKRILLEQLPIHVRPDGVYFEQSSYYHRYTTDFYTHFLILSRANGEALSGEVDSLLRSLLDHLMYITRPDGTTPLFGDDDGGRLVMLDRKPANDFRATLSTGAALFERSDYKFVAAGPAEETLWLLGVAGLETLDQIVAKEPAKQSIAFESGGYYVMRDDWTPKANYLLFDCGPHGQANCGHAHADVLGFDLAANGRTLLVDPGTYTYTGEKDLRDWFRSSPAHNTLTVNHQSSSVSAGPFSWKSTARGETRAWISQDRFDYVAGAHNGYARMSQPAAHERGILFLKHDYWVIRDRLKCAGERSVDLWFHFDPGSDPLIEAGAGQEAFIAENNDASGLDVHGFAEDGRWRREDGWVSHCYAQREPARVYVFSALLSGLRDAVSLLMPRTAEARWRVTEIETIGGRAFEVANENWLDIVMIRDRERIETARLASDFEWTWARFSQADTPILEELVLIGGRTLEVQGRQVLQAGQQLTYVTARRTDGQFQVETDKGTFDCQLPIADFEAALRG